MGTLVNSEDPDEMQHNGAFHQGLHCLLKLNQSSKKEILYFFGNYNLQSLNIYNGPSDLTVSNFMENSIGLEKVNENVKFLAVICIKANFNSNY